MSEVNPLSERGCHATPYADLIAQIMDCMEPKNEREWAAAREIERLSAERDRLDAGCKYHADNASKMGRELEAAELDIAVLTAERDRLRNILEAAVPHARWNEKMMYPCGSENYQTWTLEIHLPVPKSCADKSASAALARYLKGEAR